MALPACRKCHKEAILADAGLLKPIKYFYCRTCKIEVDGWGYPISPKPTEPLKELEDYLAKEMDNMGGYEDWDPTMFLAGSLTDERLQEFIQSICAKKP